MEASGWLGCSEGVLPYGGCGELIRRLGDGLSLALVTAGTEREREEGKKKINCTVNIHTKKEKKILQNVNMKITPK